MSADAEKAVLGAVLLDPAALTEVAETLHPGDFSTLLGETIYAAMLAMRDEQVPIDPLTLAQRLSTEEVFTRHGGPILLHDLMQATPSAANVGFYVTTVAEAAARRRATAAITRAEQLLRDNTDLTAADIIDLAAAEVSAAHRTSGALRWIGHGVDEHVAALREPVSYLPSPWPSLNHLIGGFAKGRFYVIAARPSVGKSVAGLQIAHALARHGTTSLSSLEMSHDELRERMLADLSDVTLDEIQGHRIPDLAWPRFMAAVEELRGIDIVIDERTNVAPVDIGNQARAIARRSTLSGVVLDYVQLMSVGSRRNRQEEVAEISRQLKLLARGQDVPVVALAQLNRGPEQRENKRPSMADIRESGALEQDADVVILLSRKMERDPSTGEMFESPNEVLVQVDKNRHGPRGTFTLILEGEYARLKNPVTRLQQQTYGLGDLPEPERQEDR